MEKGRIDLTTKMSPTGDRDRTDKLQRGDLSIYEIARRRRLGLIPEKSPIFKYEIADGKYLCGGQVYPNYETMLSEVEGAAD